MKKTVCILSFILFSFILKGQNVLLHGHTDQFKDEYLLLRQTVNPFTEKSTIVDSVFINSEGLFHSEFTIPKSGWYFINAGIFHTSIFLEPGVKYMIHLPPKKQKTEADIRNPYFKPVTTQLQVKKEEYINNLDKKRTELNKSIFQFDTLLFRRNNEMLEAHYNSKRYNSDSLISAVEATYENDTSAYFKKYRKYRYGLIKINSNDTRLKEIFENYLSAGEADFMDPAYMELFNKMFDKFLFFFSGTTEGKNVNYLINRAHDFEALRESLQLHSAVPNKTIAELIILKEFYNNYYENYYYKEALLLILDKLKENPDKASHAILAEDVIYNLTKLMSGNEPPAFSLYNTEDQLKTLDDFKGKYLYILFCTETEYTSLAEYPFLKAISDAHEAHLSVVSILVSDSRESMKDFVKRNKYYWTFLHYGNNDKILRDYNIKATPTAFLLDPEGKIIQAPATLATEGLEQQLFRIMRSRGDL